MKLTKAQWLKIGTAVFGIASLVCKQYLDHQAFDVTAILHSASFSDLLETAGWGAIISQVIPRFGDVSPAHVEAKVDAKVAEILSTVPPPAL
jgi:hypothetical protein